MSLKETTVVDQWFKFTATHAGRDKWYRTWQYALLALSYQAKQSGPEGEILSKQMKAWSKTLSTSRKLFRLGKWAEGAVAVYRLLLSDAKDPVEKYLKITKSMTDVVYFWLDMLLWLDAVKMSMLVDNKAVGLTRARVWVVRLASVCACAYYAILKLNDKIEKALKDGDSAQVFALTQKRNKLYREIVKCCFDIWTPIKKLEWFTGVNDFHVGVSGVAASLIGGYEKWPSN